MPKALRHKEHRAIVKHMAEQLSNIQRIVEDAKENRQKVALPIGYYDNTDGLDLIQQITTELLCSTSVLEQDILRRS